MGLVHHTATIDPTKQELVERWLPTQPWAGGRTVASKLGEYRFDDPDGEVGVETIVWTLDDGSLAQIPLTYRAAPLAGADAFLAGTMEHSVLGTCYVYDAVGDPVWAACLATAILTGGTQAQMYVERDGERVDVPARIQVKGSGAAPFGHVLTPIDSVSTDGGITTVHTGGLTLALARLVGTPVPGETTLAWLDRDGLALAALHRDS